MGDRVDDSPSPRLKFGGQAKMRLYTFEPRLESGDSGDPFTFGRASAVQRETKGPLKVEDRKSAQG